MRDTAEMSAKLKHEIEALKKPFNSFATEFGKLTATRAELAPKFAKAFGLFTSEMGGSFVDFVRLLDPSVPTNRDGYRAHRSYQAADYIRRLFARRDTAGRATRPVRSNLTAMARLIATLIPLVTDAETLWSGISAELGLRPRQTTRLRQEVGNVKPLLDLRVQKPAAAKIVHMPTAEETEERTQDARATAKRRRAA